MPLGTFDGVSYDEVAIELATGDVVVFYTDGLVEARQGREDYGPSGSAAASRPTPGSAPAKSASVSCADLEGFLDGDSPADDVTLIVVKVL